MNYEESRAKMIHILLGIEEVRAKLVSVKGSPTDLRDSELGQCIGILNNIWEVADDHKKQTPNRVLTPRRTAADHVEQLHS